MTWTDSLMTPSAQTGGLDGTETPSSNALASTRSPSAALNSPQLDPSWLASSPQTLTIIDAGIPDLERVLSGIETGEVLLLDESRNGIEQVTAALQSYNDLSSLQFISHGRQSEISLGNTTLNPAALVQSQAAIATWGHALAPGADLLFYGCNVADGSGFLQSLSDITGADVAASDDLTGSATQGADWDLEYRTGNIEAVSSLSAEAQAEFNGTLMGTGLTGRYYDNRDFTNLKFTRTDAQVNFNWGRGAPSRQMGNDTFSVVWSGQIQPRFSEEYTFYSTTDDGVRLFVDGEKVVDFFRDRPARTSNGKIRLEQGKKYDIRMEYYENGGFASSKLEWSSPSQRRQVIPKSRLFPEGTGGGGGSEPAIALGQTAYTVNEGVGTAQLRVNRSGNLSQPSTVQYQLFDDKAKGGSDYVRQNGTVRFNAGQSSANIPVQITDDNAIEGNENFNVTILAPTGATLGTQRTANVVIQDNDAPSGSGNGLKAQYYDNRDFSNLKLTRTDSTINFNWRNGSPAPGIGADTFSVRWSGQIQPRFSEEYTFYSTTDDGVRLFVNNQNVVDFFRDRAPGTSTGKIRLEAGQKYDIRMDYYENRGGAVAKLEWSSPSQGRQVIPQSQLFSSGSNGGGGGGGGNAGRFQVSNTAFTVDEATGQAQVVVERIGGSNGRATVRYATANGSARASSDYTATNGTLTFNDGQTRQTITIPINRDNTVERLENFRLNLSRPGGGAGLASDKTATISIKDDDAGLRTDTFISGLNQPTGFDWSTDQSIMFVAQKDGIVRTVKDGQLQNTPFIDLRDEVNNIRDRGLLGIAVHPDFDNGSPYVYLAYTYDPPEADRTGRTSNKLDDADGKGNRPSRVVRITADSRRGFLVARPGSKTVILGKNSTWANTSRPDGNSTDDKSIPPSGIRPNGSNVQDYLATDSESHTIGQLRFGNDKALYVSNGDGASYNSVDVRATRVLDIDNLSGKLLRIDPITGRGLSDNPFYNGNANSNRSKVYALGFRNPFRFTINKNTGQPFIGDVGWFTWEEVNAIEKGGNYGWPAYEGGATTSERTTQYKDQPEVRPFYNSIRNLKAPTLGLGHSNRGGDARAIVMGDFYTGNSFPSIYRNSLFINDANTGKLEALFFNGAGNRVVERKQVATLPGAVQVSMGKDSNLYFADLGQGRIGRVRPGGNSARASFNAAPAAPNFGDSSLSPGINRDDSQAARS